MAQSIEEYIYEMSYRIRLFSEKRGPGELNEIERLILEILGKHGEINISTLGRLLPKKQSTLSTMLSNLSEKKKLIKKRKPEGNKRMTFISLTDKGKKKLNEIIDEQFAVFGFIKTSLEISKDEEKLLRRVMDNSIRFFDAML